MRMTSRCRDLLSERGSSLVEVALILPMLLLVTAGVVDLGRAYYMANEVAAAAHAGAIFGSQNPTDTTDMVTVARNNAPGSIVSATALYGCECIDGSQASKNCGTTPTSCVASTSPVYYVSVTAKATYSALLPWPGVPSSINLSNTVEMRSSMQ